MKKIGYSLLMLAMLFTSVFANGSDESDNAALGSLAAELECNFTMGNNARTMTYQKSDPLKLPDDSIVSQGDLKPTWQYISEQIGVQIVDKAVQDQKASEMIDISAATGFTDAVVYGGNSIAEDLMNYGAQGYFINVKDYLDQMPDVKAYLSAKPNVAKAITAYDGGIYHLPYVAEIDNYARVLNCRPDWITSLLDSSSALEDESHTLDVAYEGYWDRNKTNVIELQNEAASGGTLDRDTALEVLLDYIADTYKLDKPSDLYLGEDAQYDVDEMIALWRVVELSPNTLSKVSTGAVVPGAEISPFFTRKTKNRENLFFLIPFFGGERVYGSDSDNARWYDDGEGNLVYSYASEGFLERVEYLKQLYSEGLIFSEFYDESMKDDVRKTMYFSDANEGQKQFGFMTMDWIASTTAGTPKTMAILPPVTTIEKGGIKKFVHYVENTRAIKPDGWAISSSASEAEINAALKLFNYMFSEEGNQVQNYSLPSTLVDNDVFTGPDGTEYPKFNQWMFDAADEYKNGDVSGFLRDFMGSHLALGYQKEIGFELQYTKNNGYPSWDLYTKGEVLTPTYSAKDVYLRMMPPIISLNDQDNAKLATVSVGDSQLESTFMYISGMDSSITSAADIAKLYEDAGIDVYVNVYKNAYDRMMAK